MSKLLSIQSFSEKTGISKSTLRFYEETGLILPKRNEQNGYRQYEEDQIEMATWIASLRLANVSLKEIQHYLVASEQERQRLRQTWIQALKQQRQLLDVQLKFLENNPKDEEIFLMEKQEERILWFHAEAQKGQFAKIFTNNQRELVANNIRVNNFYLTYISGRERIKAWIGFGIDDTCDTYKLTNVEKEERMNKSLCVAFNFQGDFTNIESAYNRLVQYVSDKNYVPAGSIMEMYRGKTLGDVTILIPVMKIGGDEIVSGAKG